MEIRPIPWTLLDSSVTLLVPDENGWSGTLLTNVRVLWRSKVSEYSSAIVRDNSELTVYYDCVRSLPSDTELRAGMRLRYDGEEYEILSAERFGGASPHHVKLLARHI